MAHYEIRNVPDQIARAVVLEAQKRDLSPEQAFVELVAERLGITDIEFEYHTLEDLEVVWPEEAELAERR